MFHLCYNSRNRLTAKRKCGNFYHEKGSRKSQDLRLPFTFRSKCELPNPNWILAPEIENTLKIIPLFRDRPGDLLRAGGFADHELD